MSLISDLKSAQLLAFAPLLFQAAKVMRDRGILRALHEKSATIAELSASTNTPPYGVTVLVEAGLAAGILERDGEKFRITRVGVVLERDPLTRANMDFVGDVCFQGAAALGESIETGRAAGLPALGPWANVYDGLATMGEPARSSWFAFDHFYSDDAFPLVLDRVLGHRPQRILDVGGNTGKFTLAVLARDPDVRVTVADLPGQIASCKKNLEKAGVAERVDFCPLSVLDPDVELPSGHDIIWMSQFLCCFGEDEVVHILTVAHRALAPGARLLILDNLWDRQSNDVAALCLQATSLYFTCIANGKGRMYDSKTLLRCVDRAGLEVERQSDHLGWGHTLLECRSKER